jgi:hypothetical protein
VAGYFRLLGLKDGGAVKAALSAPHGMDAEQQQAWLDVINHVDALFRAFESAEKADDPVLQDAALVDESGLIQHPFLEPPDGYDYCDREVSAADGVINGRVYICAFRREDHVDYSGADYEPPEPPDNEPTDVTTYYYPGVRKEENEQPVSA